MAAKCIPERTPKRWSLISTLVSDCTEDKDRLPEVQLTNKGRNKFSQSPEDFKNVYEIIRDQYPSMLDISDEKVMHQLGSYSDTSALKHLILIPPIKTCCGVATLIRNRPSFPLVYTTRGTFVASAFIAECRHCTKKYHLSYCEEEVQGNKGRFYYSLEGATYFQVTSQTIFAGGHHQQHLDKCSESRAKVYNENFRKVDQDRLRQLSSFGRNGADKEHPWRLTEKRAEDAWFLYSLVLFFEQRGLLKTTNFATDKGVSQRCDVDSLCGNAWELISSSSNPWIYYKCDAIGCSEGI